MTKKAIHYLANPSRFMKLADRFFPFAVLLGVLLLAAGLYFALVGSPADYQQGDAVRIMYVHVPSAWMALFIYTFMGVMAVFAYIYKHSLADYIIEAAAPIGAVFTFITLVTGMLWGKPIWGTAWVWDARLTSVLILFFLYMAYIILRQSFDHPVKGQRAGRVLVLIGLINIPIIKFSVDWWNTLHQPASISRLSSPAIDGSMLTPLLLMWVAFICYFLAVLYMRLAVLLAKRKGHRS